MVARTEIFYVYARNDEKLRNELEKRLSLLKWQGLISEWHDREIVPGEEWANQIDSRLNRASIILLLITPDFMASSYCYGVEMRRAIERHESGEAHVIPVILRPVDWENAPFGRLHVLPKNAKPVTLWQNRDEAFYNVAKGIRKAIEDRLQEM